MLMAMFPTIPGRIRSSNLTLYCYCMALSGQPPADMVTFFLPILMITNAFILRAISAIVVIQSIVKELGIHLSANHPMGPKDHFGFSYDMISSMEVWNSAVWQKNVNALLIWDDMLSSGRKITGRGAAMRTTVFPNHPTKQRPTANRPLLIM